MTARQPEPVESLLEHTGFVRNLARKVLGREEGSEDVAQDAWVAALEQGPRDPKAARGWFYRVITNRVAGLARRDAGRRRRLAEMPPAPPVPSPEEVLAREEARRRLVDALVTLEPLYREPLVLRYYEALGPSEIAARLGVPMETVRTRLRRGVEKLRERLDEGAGGRRAWVHAMLPLTLLPDGGGAAPAPGGLTAAHTAVIGALGLGVVAVGLGLGGAFERGASPVEPAVANTRNAAPLRPELRGRAPSPTTSPGAEAPGAADVQTDARAFVITVVDPMGLPVPGCEVSVAELRPEFGQRREAVRGLTDDAGRYARPRTYHAGPEQGGPAAALALTVLPPAARRDLTEATVVGWVPGDTTVALERGFTVSGEVVDLDGRPVPGAEVLLEEHGRTYRARADTSGRFARTGLPAGRWSARANVRTVTGATFGQERVLDSGTDGVRLLVPAGPVVEVRCESLFGQGASKRTARVLVTPHDPATGHVGPSVAHDVGEDGVLWLYGLEVGARCALWWGPNAWGRYAYVPAAAPGAPVTLEPVSGSKVVLPTERPAGWSGWPQVKATALGVEIFGTWAPNGDCVLVGVPGIPLLVNAEGRDESLREVIGSTRIEPGVESRLVLVLRAP